MPSVLGKMPPKLDHPELPSPEEPVFVAAEKADLPPLIAFYGTASASVWLENRYKIWRGEGSTAEDPKIQVRSLMFDWKAEADHLMSNRAT